MNCQFCHSSDLILPFNNGDKCDLWCLRCNMITKWRATNGKYYLQPMSCDICQSLSVLFYERGWSSEDMKFNYEYIRCANHIPSAFELSWNRSNFTCSFFGTENVYREIHRQSKYSEKDINDLIAEFNRGHLILSKPKKLLLRQSATDVPPIHFGG